MIGAIIAAVVFGLFALLLGAVVKLRIGTGSIMASPQPGMGSGRTTRERHPIFFWFWNLQLIGAGLMLGAVAIMCVTDAVGITDYANTIESRDAPNQ